MTSPAGIWVIVIVAVVALAFWLAGIFVADQMQARMSGRARAAEWPSYAGPAARESMPGERAAEAAVPSGEAPTRADIPAQRAAEAGRRPTMPAQRTGDADRAERSYAAPGTPDENDQGR